MTEDNQEFVIRRTHSDNRFTPRVAADLGADGVVVNRGLLGARASGKPQTSRERVVAGDLPAWEPLPPGELIVRRRP